MNIRRRLAKAWRMPWPVLARRLGGLIADRTACIRARCQDRLLSTYAPDRRIPERLDWRLSEVPLPERSVDELARIGEACRRFLEHRFDLLGSGWVAWRFGADCSGLEGHRYPPGSTVDADAQGCWLEGRVPASCQREARRIWALVSPGYEPIDWQLDARSGYRWSATIWYRDIRYGHLPGADVKLPWELARMQHLPLLAQAYSHALDPRGGDWLPADRYAQEVRDEILDFIAANPPRWGVNWACTMDVAIRAANWLVAVDVLQAGGARFDEPFLRVLRRSIREHGEHIIAHLEWHPTVRANHYLADIAGLAFVAAYLPCGPQHDAWLAFAAQELVAETALQFNADGGNFEASTAYHCLSAEMVVYASAVLVGIDEERRKRLSSYDHTLVASAAPLGPSPLPMFAGSPRPSPLPEAHWRAIAQAARFVIDFSDETRHLAQIGDNDSGRFFHWMPVLGAERSVDNEGQDTAMPCGRDAGDRLVYDGLDRRHIVGAVSAWFDDPRFAEFAGSALSEGALVRAISHGWRPDPADAVLSWAGRPSHDQSAIAEFDRRWRSAPPDQRARWIILPVAGPDLRQGLEWSAYAQTGMFAWRSPRLSLMVRCGPIGQNGNGGHAHHDQLSAALRLDGVEWIGDPGTYVYTSLPRQRRSYRSWRAHFTPRYRALVEDAEEPLFALSGDPRAFCIEATKASFLGTHSGQLGLPLYRHIEIGVDRLIIRDLGSEALADPGEHEVVAPLEGGLPPSPGYGRIRSRSRSG